MIVVKPFRADDLHAIYRSAMDETAADYNPFEIQYFAAHHEAGGCSFTGWLGDQPLGCLGVDTVRPGVGHMWATIHSDVRKYRIQSMKAVRKMLNIIEQTYGFKRLRSESRIGFPESQRFLEFLGFTRGRRTIMNGTHYYYGKILSCHQ